MASALHRIAAYLERSRPHLLLNPGGHALFLSGYGGCMSATNVGN